MATVMNTEPVVSTESNKRKRGFTLTEIAIVLGIIGLILGAIWVAAAAVYNNLRLSKANTELLEITQAVRSLYATATTVDTGAGTNETPALVNAGVFPSDAAKAGDTVGTGPWSGSEILIYSSESSAATPGDAFQVLFANIPQSACITLATGNTGSAADKGLISTDAVGSGATTYITPTYTYNQAAPMTVSDANGACTSTSADGVAFTFKLKS